MSGFLQLCSRRTIPARRQCWKSLAASEPRWYSATPTALDEEATATKKDDSEELRKIAHEFNRRKAAYKRQVSKLRKGYLEEYQRNKAEDEAQRDAEEAETTRRRLERQRAKNERSVQNAHRQQELRRQTELAFQDHLRVQQEKRDYEKDVFNRARQLVIDELEEEAPMWLTTPEEIEAAFSPEAEQALWARPQGVIGVPNPSLDSEFWQHECHTWDMSKTYKTQQDILADEYEELVYAETNIDPSYWSPEKVAEREALERKAKLRANVRTEGRKSLLRRQKEFLDEESETPEGEVPRPKPIPSLGVLGSNQAQEKEGAEMLLKDPTKFFVFQRQADSTQSETSEESELGESYSGPSLGVPVDIKDPLRHNSPQGRVFPRGVGKAPKPDMRSEKEKKRQEREEKLWAAAQAQARTDKDEIDMAADDDMEFYGEPLDYDKNDGWDSDDEEWFKGLDPDRDADLMKVPREYRYREEDIDWLIQKLETKAGQMQSHVNSTIESMEMETRSRMDEADKKPEADSQPFFDDAAVAKLKSVGGDVDRFEKLMASLSKDQMLSLFGLEANQRKSKDEATGSPFDVVQGLTSEQITGLTELDTLFKEAEKQDE
ncbi:unnamed protein product [Cylindrotheca closterium]|uniref:Uncharacterized protein n=1 Tax=Cylindrotheca closterium TaxID=2856 RepID=A0AAD2CFU1_9STRA|nr:unnamed protein product [Cylindrotheca closterium]